MSKVFDVIFAGGGTTACVIAGRLATVDPSLKILIIESGQHSRDIPRHVQPSRYVEHLAPNSTTLVYYAGNPSAHPNGGGAVVPCGRSVGGGSAVNFMMYVRGAASDYNDWAALGNTGWSFDELLPFIKKASIPRHDGSATHGYSGPIQASAGDAHFGIGAQFLEVAKAYDPTRPQVDDNNDFVTADAYSPAYQYVDPVTGRRSDAASRYLYPHASNSNLTIMVEKRVSRVIIENGRAVGVEYTTGVGSSQGVNDERVIVKASKLVVISAGTFGSPTILERSGIGSRSLLEKNQIRTQVELPGVGENFQNHVGAFPLFYASDETETMDDVWDSPKATDEWESNGTGKIAHNGFEAVLKLRPTETQLSLGGPALQRRWDSFFKNSPDKSMAIVAPCAGSPFRHLVQSLDRKTFLVLSYILYPESTGSVHITSSDGPDSFLDFEANSLVEEGDIAQLTLLYKFTRELVRRMPAYRGEVTAFHPSFPAGSSAACKERDDPVPMHAPDIVYSDVDDEAIVKFLCDSVSAAAHSLGTCAMKPRHQGGVVDARLNVYGIENLKVADMSICPTNVGNNTYSTALLIGEKAAAIIAEDLGLDI